MRIYSMTATFGKLSHETLTLEPGLNVIEAPNEWGKSTWCAFLVNMLYGIDTRARVGGSTLVDKEHYAPWNGAPMSGRIELNWQGRDITIERSSKGRILFGNFRAFETATGVEVPELTAANCGQLLLGVERSVFSRAGFIRLQELPVTQDESLRRRLNNLVTTGDENSAGERLKAELRDLKNKCRSNRANGLIPKAEAERDQLREQLRQLQELQAQSVRLQDLQTRQEESLSKLQNHLAALRYEASREGGLRITQARQEADTLARELDDLESECATLPSMLTAEEQQEAGRQLQEKWLELQNQQTRLPEKPQPAEAPAPYRDMTPEQAMEKAQADFAQQAAIEAGRKKLANMPWIYIGAAAALCVVLAILRFALQITFPALYLVGGVAILLGGLVVLTVGFARAKSDRQALDALYDAHPGQSPDTWVDHAAAYGASCKDYDARLAAYQAAAGEWEAQQAQLRQQMNAYAGEQTVAACQNHWETVVQRHMALAAKRKELRRAREHLQALQEVAGTVEPPEFPDELTLSLPQTEQQIELTRDACRQTHKELGICIGKAQSLGQEEAIRARLDGVIRRIGRLEETYKALEMAQDTLFQATTSLQRRFAPRISKRAQELFGKLTQGRYTRLALGDDLSMRVSSEDEDTLYEAFWRSDGTVDQLYLALRLAVAAELTPDSPLVLDDALVRFDDTRLAQALALLRQEADSRQVILFTCQGREKRILSEIL